MAQHSIGSSIPDEVIIILDFGSQFAQLIARRIREAGAFSVLVSPTISYDELKAMKPKGIVLSGGPSSVSEEGAPTCDPRIITELGIPVLGICYGMNLACTIFGARSESAESREYGRSQLQINDEGKGNLLARVPTSMTVWMSHGDQIENLPDTFEILATTQTCPVAAVRHRELPFYGVQFHPEVTHTPHGIDILRNFLYEVCGCQDTWKMSDFLEVECKRIRNLVKDDKVICGLSGGVDSSVLAVLLHNAIGDQLTCVFVDNGLLRIGERELVESTFRGNYDINLIVVDASKEFLADLDGITDPQEKRKRIGHRFIDVFDETAKGLGEGKFLAQGTLYPDVIESGHGHAGTAANIKLHHNVGGLPDDLDFELLEPLRELFKDDVRILADVMGLPRQIAMRHPFPGPGLAVRVLGEITAERLRVVRECDKILLEEIVAHNLYESTSQVFAVLLPVQSVGVMGDGRTYESVVAIRAVETQDFMTADWARIPFDVLAIISNRIINEVRGVNRVVYDISSKPPATIEWE